MSAGRSLAREASRAPTKEDDLNSPSSRFGFPLALIGAELLVTPKPAFVPVPLRVGPPETVRPAAGPAPEACRLEPVPCAAVKIGDAFWAPRNATRSLGSLRWIPRPQRRIGPIVSDR
jgi:hypothetical protein